MLDPIEIDPRTFLREHCALPCLPEVLEHLQKAIRDEDMDMDKMVAAISSEPAVLAQVLKVVNSSYYGLSKEIVKVRIAIAFLGLNEIYRMVLSLSVINALNIRDRGALRAFWLHSCLTALCAKYLARKYEPRLCFDALWSAAVLHDIGKLVYLRFFPDHYRALSAFSRAEGTVFSRAERHFCLPSSGFLGTLLCDRWRLPHEVRMACEKHTLDDLVSMDVRGPSAAFCRIICLANLLALLRDQHLGEGPRGEIIEAVKGATGCGEESFLAMMADVFELGLEAEAMVERFH